MSKDSTELARAARISALKMVNTAKASHIGSSLSVIDILSVIYCGIKRPQDVVIVSKGHAAAGTYSVLAHAGQLPLEDLSTYGNNGSKLGGHVNHSGNPNIRLSTGSLGHGLPYGIGIAIAQNKKGMGSKTYIVISDGECDEGTTWESALLANHFCLENLIVIIDRNRMQSLKSTEDTLKLEPLAEKWKSFNWSVVEVDGHNHDELERNLKVAIGPLLIIANTIKGKGVSFMENNILWHYRPPSEKELNLALSELENEK